ncbi:MAG: hypothetical protein J6T10_30800 [Methanobrevibacter sp.]|nr:hypothetical protein [Methanobrevibacter sp.]
MANIVYNDLKKSPFKVDYEGFELYFSSAFHKNKFNKNIKEYIKEETLKFQNRYKVKIELLDIFIIAYYKKCENRGFRVYRDNLELSADKVFKNIIL